MTDHRSWLWRRRPSEKTIAVAEKQDLPSKANDEEIHILLAEKAELERDLKDLNDKLSFALSECNANDELAKKHAETAEDAITGWEKAEAKTLSLKEELEEALEQRAACEERIIQLEAALKKCMQQLRFVREEKEERIHDVLAKAAKDYDEKRLAFEEKLLESSKKITELQSEITELSEVLFLKEELVDELNQKKARLNAELKELSARLESTEKQNASLKYEVRVLEKELHIRNEEREFNRQTANATHKQHLEDVKKVAKLESECQRLRVLVRKRLPGPAAVAKMKNEIQMLERGPKDTRRRRTMTNGSNSSAEIPAKKINLLAEKLGALEEENNVLRQALEKKTNELQLSRNMYARASMKLTRAESQLEESSKTQMIMELMKSGPWSDDKVSCAESWSSTLVSKLDKSKDRKKKSVASMSSISNGVSSDINLMDDFVEMEKLALVCVDKPTESSPTSDTKSDLDAAGKQTVPMFSCQSGLSRSISKLIQIIEGINFPSQEDYDKSSPTYKSSKTLTGYVIRVFQWKTSELAAIVGSFLHVCYDLLNGKVGFERFSEEVASTLEWMINHCLSVQDVSSMKNAIKKQFDLHEVRKPESAKMEVEEKHGAMVDNSKSPSVQLENHKLKNDDLNAQLSVAKVELDDACHNPLCLEAETEYKCEHSEELESRCRQLQIHNFSATTKNAEDAVHDTEDEKQLQTNWDIMAASEKLVKCQETIFNLGKQLKAMTSTHDIALVDNIVSSQTNPPPGIPLSTPKEKGTNQLPSLLDKMLEEDDDDEFPTTKEIICTSDHLKPPPGFIKGTTNPTFESDCMRRSFREAGFKPLAIVPKKKKHNGGLFKKLLWRKKRINSKRIDLPFSTC